MDHDPLSEASLSTAPEEPTSDGDDADVISSAPTEESSTLSHTVTLPTATSLLVGDENANQDQASSVPDKSPREPNEPHKTLSLLDLPLDILREIVKEITLTHDLTSLARTCSALHGLAIPAMYSRFDIVWPEPTPVSDQPVGVDALSYGLATLVMGANAFKETSETSSRHYCQHCGCDGSHHQVSPQMFTSPLRTKFGQFRIGNQYAQWTKKFCVGNGPSEWVQEYAITRETGKLLGTLVALAVSRMINLESFIWDMPTGVMRDVFLALASLDTRPGCDKCRLEKVWIRWHDNDTKVAPFTGVNTLSALRRINPVYWYRGVEYPTFSVLPPLKSLSVLNIDEPAYLEEMAIIINRSRNKLEELRIGMAATPSISKWVYPTEMAPPPNAHSQRFTPGWPRPGGVLSILQNVADSKQTVPSPGEVWIEEGNNIHVSSPPAAVVPPGHDIGVDMTTQMLGGLAVDDAPGPEHISAQSTISVNSGNETKKDRSSPQSIHTSPDEAKTDKPENLKLQLLELENVVIHTPTLMTAIDWSRLTTLTILQCEGHESLWRALRRKYSPPTEINMQNSEDTIAPANYPFKLKHIHTDRVSPYLMLFLKEAIAPNTLESVYFQEGNGYTTVVSIEAIYKHVLRRQRASLRKVLIDRSRRGEAISANHGHWRDWMLSREALAFVTSGRMPELRELAIGMDRRDWHFFLQRLPKLANLRAFYLPNMFDPTLGRNKHRELALQVLDIVTLRPEIQLCYIGIEHKCFEILETPISDKKGNNELYRDSPWYSDSESEVGDHVNGHDSESNTDEEDDHDGDNNSENTVSIAEDDDDTDGDNEDHDGSGGSRFVFRLREILFYDDKISVFKARHCSL